MQFSKGTFSLKYLTDPCWHSRFELIPGLLFGKIWPRRKPEQNQTLPTMSDEEAYTVEAKREIDGPPQKDGDNGLSATDLEPFGNEEKAEVKYRTMKWW